VVRQSLVKLGIKVGKSGEYHKSVTLKDANFDEHAADFSERNSEKEKSFRMAPLISCSAARSINKGQGR